MCMLGDIILDFYLPPFSTTLISKPFTLHLLNISPFLTHLRQTHDTTLIHTDI